MPIEWILHFELTYSRKVSVVQFLTTCLPASSMRNTALAMTKRMPIAREPLSPQGLQCATMVDVASTKYMRPGALPSVVLVVHSSQLGERWVGAWVGGWVVVVVVACVRVCVWWWWGGALVWCGVEGVHRCISDTWGVVNNCYSLLATHYLLLTISRAVRVDRLARCLDLHGRRRLRLHIPSESRSQRRRRYSAQR